MPETPNSHIRRVSSYSSPSIDGLCQSPKSSRGTAGLAKVDKLSPICLSPRSKGLSVRTLISNERGRAKREEGCTDSRKRLFSPPEESHNAKRPRTVLSPAGSSLKVTRSVIGREKTPHVSGDQRHSRGTDVVFNERKTTTTSLKPVSRHSLEKHQEKREEDENNSGFTVITSGEPHTRLPVDSHTLAAYVHKPTAQTITPAPQASPREGAASPEETETTTTALTSHNGDNVPLSNQEQAAGTIWDFN